MKYGRFAAASSKNNYPYVESLKEPLDRNHECIYLQYRNQTQCAHFSETYER